MESSDKAPTPTKPDAPAAGSGAVKPEQLETAALVAALSALTKKLGGAEDRDLVAAAARRLRTLDTALAQAAAAAAAAAEATGTPAAAPADLPLVLDSTAHVMRDVRKAGKVEKQLHVVKGGVLVSQTDLTPDEIAELKTLGAIRVATIDEIVHAARG